MELLQALERREPPPGHIRAEIVRLSAARRRERRPGEEMNSHLSSRQVKRRDALTKAEEIALQKWLATFEKYQPIFLSFEKLKAVRSGTLRKLGRCARALDKARRAAAKVRGRQKSRETVSRKAE